MRKHIPSSVTVWNNFNKYIIYFIEQVLRNKHLCPLHFCYLYMIILKLIIKKWDVNVWIEFNCLCTGTTSSLLWTRYWKSGFHRRQRISWPIEWPWLCFMELVS
jgi:hypothetical protein